MEGNQKIDGNYTVLASNTLQPNRCYNVAVTVHNTIVPVTINIYITGPSFRQAKTIDPLTPDNVQIIQFQIPDLEAGAYQLTAEGVKGMIFKDTTELLMERLKTHIIIQIDQLLFKPGDKINFRVIFLDEHLRPVVVENKAMIWIEDPNCFHMLEIDSFTTTFGVYAGTFDLSKFALVGTWHLCVSYGQQKIEKVQFEVEKFIQPKFVIRVESTPNVAVQDGSMQVIVKAQYSYGKPIEGKVVLTIKLITYDYYQRLSESATSSESNIETLTPPGSPVIIRSTEMVNGMATFYLNVKEYENFMTDKLGYSMLDISANVEETITKIQLTGSAHTTLYPYRFRMSSIGNCSTFQAGKDAEVSFKIEHVDYTPVNHTKSMVRLTYNECMNHNLSLQSSSEAIANNKRKALSYESHMNDLGIVRFIVNLPALARSEENQQCYTVNLEYAGEKREICRTYPQKTKNKPLVKTNKMKKDFFQLEISGQDAVEYKIGDTVKIKVNSSKPLNYVVYAIVARGVMLKSYLVKLRSVGEYQIEFPITFDMVPFATIFANNIDEAGKLRFHGLQINVKMELQNKIEIVEPPEMKVGDAVHFIIKTAPQSFVGLTAINHRSLQYGKHKVFNEIKIANLFNKWNSRKSPNKNLPGYKCGLVALTNGSWNIKKDTFKLNYDNRMVPRKTSRELHETEFGEDLSKTWFFDDIKSIESAVVTCSKIVPNLMTSWLISGFCVHRELGFGVTREFLRLKTSKPFSISIPLPYSVIRGETIRLAPLILNYSDRELEFQLTLDCSNDEFEFVEADADKQTSKTFRVLSNSVQSAVFSISPKVVGNMNLKFTALTNFAEEIVHSTLKVVPEGITKFVNSTQFINLNENLMELSNSYHPRFPDHIEQDSKHIQFSIVSDLFGPLLAHLEHAESKSMVCAEEAVSLYLTNVLALEYLQSFDGETERGLKQQINNNLSIGYQNIMNYFNDDGSFRIYSFENKTANQGFTWITSYVLYALSRARNHCKLDEKIFDKGFKYLVSRQIENGCFTEERANVLKEHSAGLVLTAYALLAFLQNEKYAKRYEQQMVSAVKYLAEQSRNCDSTYSSVVVTYALMRAKKKSTFFAEFPNLSSMGEKDQYLEWWEEIKSKQELPQSGSDVAITSFVILILLEEDITSTEEMFPIIKWLVEKRYSRDVFAHSHDTVIAFQALAKFAKRANYASTKMTVDVETVGDDHKANQVHIIYNNPLEKHIFELPASTKCIEYTAKGRGLALAQISYQYNTMQEEQSSRFKLSAYTKSKTTDIWLLLNVVVEYKGDKQSSNMTVLEVALPSGYTTDIENLEHIRKIEHVIFVEARNMDSKIFIYSMDLPKSQRMSMKIRACKEHDVLGLKREAIVLYDLYDITKRSNIFYNLKDS